MFPSKQNNNKSGKKSNGSKRRNRAGRAIVPRVPTISASVVVQKVVRYQAGGSSFSGSVTAQDLAQLFFVGATTTTAFSLIGGIELTRIRMWGPSPNPGEVSTVSCEFDQDSTTFIGSPSIIKTDTSVTSMAAAYIDMVPPKNSLSGFWISGSATSGASVFSVEGPEMTIIDLHVNMTLLDSGTVGQAVSVTAVVPGVLYFKKLPGFSGTAVLWPPYT